MCVCVCVCVYVCIFGIMRSAHCYNLVLVINGQGNTCTTIDYIKKKQTDPGVSS